MIDKEAYKRISNGETHFNYCPCVQILGIEKAANGYLLDLNDGESNFQGLYLGTKLKEALASNMISSSDLITLQDYCFNQTVEVPLIIFEFEQTLNPDLSIRPPRSESDSRISRYTPISELLNSSKWELKVRILDKQNIKDYRHSNDIGKYFKMIVIDCAGSLAEMVFFGAKVEEYFKRIQRFGVYSISQGVVNPPHPHYRREGVLYEIRSTRETKVLELDDDPLIPTEVNQKKVEVAEPKGPIINECGVFEEVKNKEEVDKLGIKKINDLYTFEQIRAMKGQNDSKITASVLCTIGKLPLNERENLWYQGCPNVKCKRKVNIVDFEKFYCTNCRMNYQNYTYRYRVMLPLHDMTGMYRVKIFDNFAENLLKIPAQQLSYMSEVNHSKAEAIILALFGKKIIADLQITFTGSTKDVVLIKTRPVEEALDSIMADIDYIARISFP